MNLPGKDISILEGRIFQEYRDNQNSLPHHHLFSTVHTPSLKMHFLFELKTLVGRAFLNRKPPRKQKDFQLLHFGCGFRIFNEFVNADMYQYRFWRRIHDWMLDIRYPLNCEDNYWDGIFTEHVLEHMHAVHVHAFLKEAYRTLKPGSHIRIIVPDVRIYMNWYDGNRPHDRIAERWASPIEGINSLTQNWLHKTTWDAELMGRFLKDVGFKDIRECSFMVGRDPKLLKDNEYNDYESLYIEATK